MDKLRMMTTWLILAGIVAAVIAVGWTPDITSDQVRFWGLLNTLWPILVGAALVSWIVELAVRELVRDRHNLTVN